MTDVRTIAQLLGIAQRALDADDRAIERRHHEEALKGAYLFHKALNGLDRVESGTSEWDAMLVATKSEYEDAEEAKRAEYNAKRRLLTAIRTYRNKVYA